MINKRLRRLIALGSMVILLILTVILYFGGGKPVLTAVFRDGAYGTRIEIDTSFGYAIRKYDGGVAIFGKEGILAITNAGRKAWEKEFPATNPILSANGSFVLAADRGGKSAILLADGKEKRRIETKDSILSVDVNAKGNFLLVTEERGYKGCVRLFNSAGKEIYTWHSAEQNILSAAVSEDGKQLAVAVVNTEELSKLCTVFLFKINDTTPKALAINDENLAIELIFCGRELMVIGDESVHCFKEDGTKKFVIDYAGRDLQAYSFYSDGVLALGLSGNSSINGNIAEMYDTNGKLKGSYQAKGTITCMDSYGKYVAVNTTEGLTVVDSAGRVKSENTLEIATQEVFLCGSRNRVFIISGISAGMYIL